MLKAISRIATIVFVASLIDSTKRVVQASPDEMGGFGLFYGILLTLSALSIAAVTIYYIFDALFVFHY